MQTVYNIWDIRIFILLLQYRIYLRMTSDSIVIIPTYNEKENMENIIRAVFGLKKCFHILVIDDGSPDGTAHNVHRLINEEFANR